MKYVQIAIALAMFWVTSAQAVSQCVPIPLTTVNMPAPQTGSMTISALTGYGNYPAQACINMDLLANPMAIVNGGTIPYTLQTSLAVKYNNVTTPNCAGLNMTLNGGPVQTYIDSAGSVSYSPATQTVSGTMNTTYYVDVNTLNVSANGQNYTVDTPLQKYTATTTFSGNKSSTHVCLKAAGGGIGATVNGQPFTIPPSIWSCLDSRNDPNTVVVFDQNC